MATVLVRYHLSTIPPRSDVMEIMMLSAQNKFKGLPHLHSKQFCYDEKTGDGLSVYLWDSRANAEAFFTKEFIDNFTEKFGAVPSLEYYDTLLTVDNRVGDIVVEE